MRNSLFILVLAIVVLGTSAGVSAGTLVVANKSEATVSLVDTETGEIRATLPAGNAPHEVDVSPDGRLALVGNYGTREEPGSTLTVVDVGGARVVRTIALDGYSRPHGIVWLDDRFALVTVEANRAVVKVDAHTGEVVQEMATEADVSHMVAVARGQNLAFVANIGSDSVSVLDLAAGARLENIATGKGAEGVAVTPDGKQVWVTNRAEDTITVLETGNRAPLARIEAGSFPIRAEATGDGRYVLVTNARGNDLSVYSTEELKEVGTVGFEAVSKDTEGRLFSDRFGSSSVPIGIEIVDEENRAYVAHANADDISIIDLEQWKVVGTLSAGEEPDGMGYSPMVPIGDSASAGD